MQNNFTYVLIISHNWIYSVFKSTKAEKTLIKCGCSSVVERLLCMCEVLGSIPSISKHCSMTFMQNNFTYVLIISHNWIYSVSKSTKAEKTLIKWGCSSVVERLLFMYEVQGSIPSISKKCAMIFMRNDFTFFLIIYHNCICGICKSTETERYFFNRGCSSVVERLLFMYEVLGTIPSISKHCSMTFMQNYFPQLDL